MGRLISLNHTRLDIAFVVGKLSQHVHNPREIHLQAAHKVLVYLKGMVGQRLLFKQHNNLHVEIFINVDFVGYIVDRRSTFGYYIFLGNNLVL